MNIEQELYIFTPVLINETPPDLAAELRDMIRRGAEICLGRMERCDRDSGLHQGLG